VTTLDPRQLGDALRAGASGTHPLEAGTGLLTDCGSWLHRGDFTNRFITTGISTSDGVTLLASADWEAAVTALHTGELPASGGERRMLLLASSLAGGTPVSLSDTLVGIDRRNAGLVVSAVAAPSWPRLAAARACRRAGGTGRSPGPRSSSPGPTGHPRPR
jgi:hypothetical protein